MIASSSDQTMQLEDTKYVTLSFIVLLGFSNYDYSIEEIHVYFIDQVVQE